MTGLLFYDLEHTFLLFLKFTKVISRYLVFKSFSLFLSLPQALFLDKALVMRGQVLRLFLTWISALVSQPSADLELQQLLFGVVYPK